MTSNPISSSVLSPPVQDAKQAQDQQPPAKEASSAQQGSTVVKLSAEGQQLSRSDATNSQGSNSEHHEPPAKEAAEPAGIQFMEGENKGGRVSTFA